MALYVPCLSKKLECLYQRHEVVNMHKQLASYLALLRTISLYGFGGILCVCPGSYPTDT